MKTDQSTEQSEAEGGSSRRDALRAGAAALTALSIAGLGFPASALARSKSSSAGPTRFVEVGGRKLAYRSVGEGKPIVLAHRFRGVLGLWDPAFIDALASHGHQVVTFDYSGMGLSTGEKTYNPMALLKDMKDLVDGLGLKDVVIGGWSYGAIVAELYVALFGASVSHAVMIAGVPPGKLAKAGEQRFIDLGTQETATLEQYTGLFFEPDDAASRAASKQSFDRIFSPKNVRSPDVAAEWAKQQVPGTPPNPVIPSDDVMNALKHTNVPMLHLNGDHDISFPVENWYALNRQFPTLTLITYPRAGHGAHFQYPDLAASHIAAFIKYTKKA